jgi:hypothetical protein
LCLKSQIPSTPPKERRAGKLQINPPAIARHGRAGLKFQIPNRFNVQRGRLRRVLLFIYFFGFFIWNFNMIMNFQQSKSPLGITKSEHADSFLTGYRQISIGNKKEREQVLCHFNARHFDIPHDKNIIDGSFIL